MEGCNGSLDHCMPPGEEYSFLTQEAAEDVLSTGSLRLDIATGIGGIPRGRITDLSGPQSAGMQTFALLTAANAQRQGLRVQWVDLKDYFDLSLDLDYARQQGVDNESLVVTEPTGGNQAMEALIEASGTGDFGLVILNSADLMYPIWFLGEGVAHGMGVRFNNPGNVQRLLNQGLEKLAPVAKKTNTTIVFINRIKTHVPAVIDLGMSAMTVIRQYVGLSIELSLDHIEPIKGELRSITTKTLVVHNDMGPSGGKAYVTLTDGLIDHVGDLLVLGQYHEIIRKLPCGTWSYRNTEIGMDLEIEGWVKENRDVAIQIRQEILSKGLNQPERGFDQLSFLNSM